MSDARGPAEDRGPLHVRPRPALQAPERLPVIIADDHGELVRQIAARIASVIRANARAGQPAVLGLATGSTPIGIYRELVRLHREEGLSFANVVTFNLDEYYGIPADSLHSYHRYMWEHLFAHVNIVASNVHIPDGMVPRDAIGAYCASYDAAIVAAGGLDFLLLGIGKTGHIGFNEPGSGAQSRTRLMPLDHVTRRDAAADFFGEAYVPREAITMGVATILEAREIVLLATGEHKAAIVRRTVEGDISVDVTATFLQRHPDVTLYLDGAASATLTRVATPWLLDAVEWTPALVVRAVIWLSQRTDTAILKLTLRHYTDHHLSSLVARYGSAGAVNGEVFNALGAKIRGKAKLPHGQRIVVFSPHPDDDVISMGGILHKLVQNGNTITVAYMTSGNIAVFDHDVRRAVDFLERLAATRGDAPDVHALAAEVRTFLAQKQPGEPDSPAIQSLKQLLRESEAVSGLETVGLSAAHARFLNMPFYQTGKVKKDPIGPADVAIIDAVLHDAAPDLVFIAGDLSDPHGTHRMCKEAIDRAMAARWPSGAEGRPERWLYRGAWQEWPIADATWLVPMSQDEMHLKIQAIFKHQSQKDSAPFPGLDDREFWQRVAQRNQDTAATLNALGLAEYFAMEAYVVE